MDIPLHGTGFSTGALGLWPCYPALSSPPILVLTAAAYEVAFIDKCNVAPGSGKFMDVTLHGTGVFSTR